LINLGINRIDFFFLRSNSDVIVYIKPDDLQKMSHENSMWLGNHRYEVDWLLGWVFTQRLGLAGVRLFFSKMNSFIQI
jgi:hypothetical protein